MKKQNRVIDNWANLREKQDTINGRKNDIEECFNSMRKLYEHEKGLRNDLFNFLTEMGLMYEFAKWITLNPKEQLESKNQLKKQALYIVKNSRAYLPNN